MSVVGTAWKIWPMSTDMTVMMASAPAHPANVRILEERAARSAAMKNVLSPISETCEDRGVMRGESGSRGVAAVRAHEDERRRLNERRVHDGSRSVRRRRSEKHCTSHRCCRCR